MAKALFIIFLIITSFTNAQKSLKKRFLGLYEGEIPAYKINTGSQFIDVSSTPISLVLKKNEFVFKVGRNEMTGTYSWIKKDNKTIQIEFLRPEDETKEIVTLTKKTKQILREGVFPQPKATLKKSKRKR
jgi:hypothetical protein